MKTRATDTSAPATGLLPAWVRDELAAAAKSYPDDPNRRNIEIDRVTSWARHHYPQYFIKEQ